MQKTMSKILSRTIILKARIIPASFAPKGLPKSINNYFTSHAGLLKEPEKFIEKLFIAVLDRIDLSPGSEESIKIEYKTLCPSVPSVVNKNHHGEHRETQRK